MQDRPAGHQHSAAELKRLMEADRGGDPLLVLRDGEGEMVIVSLPADRGRLAVGRVEGSDLMIGWDSGVSRLHAELERVGGAWVIADDGLSSNGTFVNGGRLHGRKRLQDGDLIRVGSTSVRFRDPLGEAGETAALGGSGEIDVSPAQRRVLVELCRPIVGGGAVAAPATNQAIADALFISTDSVKTHMRALFDAFAIEDLPHNRKRARLAEQALELGAVAFSELRD